MKMNKKGWLRIIEASIGIIVILGVLVAISFRQNKTIDPSLELAPYLDEMAKNQTLREGIIAYDLVNLNNSDNSATIEKITGFFYSKINKNNYNIYLRICSLEDLCPIENYPINFDGNIYSAERIVSSGNTEGFTPRKVKVFVWQKV